MGTTTPATGTTLHIDGAKDNTSATPTATEAANDVVVTSTGKVGIGTSNPTQKLVVSETTTGSSGAIVLETTDNTKNSTLRVSTGTTSFGYLASFGSAFTPNGVLTPNSAGLYSSVLTSNGLFLASQSTNGSIKFATNGFANERMRITETGNIGIGTTTPTEKLDVAGSIKMVDGNQAAGAFMISDADGKATWTPASTALGTASSKFTNDAANTRVSLTNLSDGTTARPAGKEFVVSDTGNVGVGTVAPTYKLEVNQGDIQVVGTSRNQMISISRNDVGNLYNWKFAGASSGNVQKLHILDDKVGGSGNMMTFDGSTGNVGIGNATPQVKLDVNGAIKMVDGNQAAGAFMISDADGKATWTPASTALGTASSKFTNDAANTRVALTNLSDGATARPTGKEFVVKDNGNVGIGTSNPTQKLVVSETTTGSSGAIILETSDDTKNSILRVGTGTTSFAYLSSYGSAYTPNGVITPNSAGLFTSSLTSNGLFLASQSPSGSIKFATGGLNERMVLTSGGRLGIGLTAPRAPFDVKSSISIAAYFDHNGDSSSAVTIGDISDITSDTGIYLRSSGVNSIQYVSEATFQIKETNGDINMTILGSSGNVGIGHITPQAKLDVNGAIKIGDSLSTPVAGMIRFNGTNFQGYNGTAWVNLD